MTLTSARGRIQAALDNGTQPDQADIERLLASEKRALVGLEAAERITSKTFVALRNGNPTLALDLLTASIGVTTGCIVNAVKDQAFSDEIAAEARVMVADAVRVMDAVRDTLLPSREPEVVVTAVEAVTGDGIREFVKAVKTVREALGSNVHSSAQAVREEYARQGKTLPSALATQP